jgi:1-acyl-sn-glycerol-3-phosphate acyltransferase
MLTWIAVVLFFIVTAILSIISVPVALIDRSGKGYLWLSRVWSVITLKLFRIRVRIEGIEHIDRTRNYVYAANHASYTDISVLLASVPDNIRLILRDSLTRIPIWGWSLLASPFIIINRSSPAKSKASIEKAVETIRKGASVLLFPEGTRTADGAMQPFKRGAFRLAFDSGVAVVPVAVLGTYNILSRHKSLPLPGTVVVRLGKPIEQSTVMGRNEREREIAMMKLTEESVRQMLEIPS